MTNVSEVARSHTPTITADLHSETGSAHSGPRLSYSRPSESRRLSSTNAAKLTTRAGPSSLRIVFVLFSNSPTLF